MRAVDFCKAVGADFYAGVPDSLLSPLADYLMETYGESGERHVIAANEGNAVGLAAGYHLVTGKVPAVYLQNSGEGNIVNPYASLLHANVYGIPCLFIIGWRGEPGVKDEPQHAFQGRITRTLLDTLEIPHIVLSKETKVKELQTAMADFHGKFKAGQSCAVVVRKGALEHERKGSRANAHSLTRESILNSLLEITGEDILISTTGKTSRELFELREFRGEGHDRDFLTVGSMGHSSSIALGVAMQKKECRIWAIDGDGAALMHLGAMAVIGARHPANLIHVVINNEAHESVGGLPTAGKSVDLPAVARACGYANVFRAATEAELHALSEALREVRGLTFVEIKAAIGSRSDLGRPTTTPRENKVKLMERLQ
ncbi:phosphonopyruvate decarboxylase [Selenomonas sp. TAMA-11512]|uniref:phosphonopyruvate decarboxylase n=1 Tax=Selenomonas sp. TAMA-11512 TaxID=3095337 RepID=UPI003086927E|nr:phosphonopyruvate decarboxylase [Selenomonas sp. TAMA-11512]